MGIVGKHVFYMNYLTNESTAGGSLVLNIYIELPINYKI